MTNDKEKARRKEFKDAVSKYLFEEVIRDSIGSEEKMKAASKEFRTEVMAIGIGVWDELFGYDEITAIGKANPPKDIGEAHELHDNLCWFIEKTALKMSADFDTVVKKVSLPDYADKELDKLLNAHMSGNKWLGRDY